MLTMAVPLAPAFAILLGVAAPAAAPVQIENCGSAEFRQEFLAGSHISLAGGIGGCGNTTPSHALVAAGDRVLPCLEAIVHDNGAAIAECPRESMRCRNWAFEIIAAIGTSRAAAFLIPIVRDSSDEDLLLHAVDALGTMRAREAIPVLHARLESGTPRVRALLVWSLGQLRDKEHSADLVAASDGLTPEQLSLALSGFLVLKDPSVVPALRRYVVALPPSERLRRVIEQNVNEIAVVANLHAGIEQMDRGKSRRAESFFRAAINEAEKTGSDRQARMEAIFRLGDLCRRSGRLDEAETLLWRASKEWRGSPPSISKPFDIDIALALTLDARGMSAVSADALANIANVLAAERPAETTGAEARFPELRTVFKRYVPFCRTRALGCEGSFESFFSRRS
jgi:tetratricopeptide (TPR) repeat protein